MSRALQRVREARMEIKKLGSSDVSFRDSLEDLFEQAQALVAEMNKAKLEAVREAERPYLEKLEELDAEIATYIILMG